jgi:hypothetical protein
VAASTTSAGGSACYLQTVPVQTGERYVVMGWARLDPAKPKAQAHLTVRFRDAKGAWHPRRDLEPTLQADPEDGEWQPLLVPVTIPAGAAALIVMPGTRGQEAGEQAFFDDLAVYPLPTHAPPP